jgi:methylene-tetrahydromethanopterin dehydrogenase
VKQPYLLHIFTPAKNVSPFDVNMAYDAGWEAATPYTAVETGEIRDLVQDVVFSRGPSGVRCTGIFLGGRDVDLAMDMLEEARAAMVPPFEVSVFADPSGAFTTAAAMVAAVERQLERTFHTDLNGQEVLVLGGTGPVGAAAAVLSAKAGGRVTILSREKGRADRMAVLYNHRYGSDLTGIKGDINDHVANLMQSADVVMGTAKAGVQVLGEDLVVAAPRLKVAADVNAVPPAGIAGVGPQDAGVLIPGSNSGALGIGALAIGNIKYQTQHRLLIRMREADTPQYLHFDQAFEFARDHVRNA